MDSVAILPGSMRLTEMSSLRVKSLSRIHAVGMLSVERITGAADGQVCVFACFENIPVDGQVCLCVYRKHSRGGREFDGAIEGFELLVCWLGAHAHVGMVPESIKKNFEAVMGQEDISADSQLLKWRLFWSTPTWKACSLRIAR